MKFVDKADSFFKKIIKVEKALGALSLFIMLVICFSAVIMRYVFNDPWTWSEEVILIILVIFGYLCISIDVYNDEHIALTFLYNAVPKWAKTAMDCLRHILIGGFFLLMANYGVQIYQIKANKQLAATGWSQGIVYFAQVVVSVLVPIPIVEPFSTSIIVGVQSFFYRNIAVRLFDGQIEVIVKDHLATRSGLRIINVRFKGEISRKWRTTQNFLVRKGHFYLAGLADGIAAHDFLEAVNITFSLFCQGQTFRQLVGQRVVRAADDSVA
mgnify:CR=1 FL=1